MSEDYRDNDLIDAEDDCEGCSVCGVNFSREPCDQSCENAEPNRDDYMEDQYLDSYMEDMMSGGGEF
jgi:hypothetical protein